MKTMTAQNVFYQTANRNKESIAGKILKAYAEAVREDQASIICGMAMMSGSTHIHSLYKALSA